MSRTSDLHQDVADQNVAGQDVRDLESVISTPELSLRPTRAPDHASENRALVALVEAMTASPDDILQKLAETALDLCRAHSAGLSLLDGNQKRFRWAAVAGRWAPHLGGGTPRGFGPCGTVLDRNVPLLFSRPERHFKYLASVAPYIEEGLLLPFYVGGRSIGTIWVIAHDQSRRFDAEDLRVMTNLSHFAAAVYAARTRQVAVQADVHSALATENSLRGILQACTEAVARHLDAALARIWVITKDKRVLELQASAGMYTHLDGAHSRVPVGYLRIGLIVQERTPYVTNDVVNDPLLSDSDWARDEGMVAFAGYPLVVGGQAIGVLTMFSRKPISRATAETLSTIAGTIAQGIRRAQGEAALRRSEAFLAEGQRLSLTGSFSWRVATDEIMWSEQVYRIFEFDQSVPVTLELIGTRVHPEDLPLMHEIIERARGDGSDFEYEHRLQMPDHSVKHLHIVAHGTRDQDGRLEYIGAVQDVTQARRSEEALGKARSELAHVARVTSLGVLTASIAHEVNQPLSGIVINASTCLRMLAADPPNVDGARETARRMIRDANRASDVITRLRGLFGKKDAKTDSVDLNEVARGVIAMSMIELQRSRVILRLELADDLPLVTGDRVQLQQVILNLLLNAADAMSGVDDRPRQLVIRTERDEGDGVRLRVQDVGVGLEPQYMDKLFEEFYTTKPAGMGIGLFVSRSIIESHHGRLWAAANDGPGATFSFVIPRAPHNVTADVMGNP
ncbi:MAG TPA: GAF domain-containing protein [Burkholderiales bacterium]|nr:GAF domain-containing protein [Burkholderiales bacterium]